MNNSDVGVALKTASEERERKITDRVCGIVETRLSERGVAVIRTKDRWIVERICSHFKRTMTPAKPTPTGLLIACARSIDPASGAPKDDDLVFSVSRQDREQLTKIVKDETAVVTSVSEVSVMLDLYQAVKLLVGEFKLIVVSHRTDDADAINLGNFIPELIQDVSSDDTAGSLLEAAVHVYWSSIERLLKFLERLDDAPRSATTESLVLELLQRRLPGLFEDASKLGLTQELLYWCANRARADSASVEDWLLGAEIPKTFRVELSRPSVARWLALLKDNLPIATTQISFPTQAQQTENNGAARKDWPDLVNDLAVALTSACATLDITALSKALTVAVTSSAKFARSGSGIDGSKSREDAVKQLRLVRARITLLRLFVSYQRAVVSWCADGSVGQKRLGGFDAARKAVGQVGNLEAEIDEALSSFNNVHIDLDAVQALVAALVDGRSDQNNSTPQESSGSIPPQNDRRSVLHVENLTSLNAAKDSLRYLAQLAQRLKGIQDPRLRTEVETDTLRSIGFDFNDPGTTKVMVSRVKLAAHLGRYSLGLDMPGATVWLLRSSFLDRQVSEVEVNLTRLHSRFIDDARSDVVGVELRMLKLALGELGLSYSTDAKDMIKGLEEIPNNPAEPFVTARCAPDSDNCGVRIGTLTTQLPDGVNDIRQRISDLHKQVAEDPTLTQTRCRLLEADLVEALGDFDSAGSAFAEIRDGIDTFGDQAVWRQAHYGAIRCQHARRDRPDTLAFASAFAFTDVYDFRLDSLNLYGKKESIFPSFRGSIRGAVFAAIESAGLRDRMPIDFDRPVETDFDPTIYGRLMSAKSVVVFLSHDYFSSDWCKNELTVALQHNRFRGTKLFYLYVAQGSEDRGRSVTEFLRWRFGTAEGSPSVARDSYFARERVERLIRYGTALTPAKVSVSDLKEITSALESLKRLQNC
jgi:hypothetical protein